jgi:peroxiredoxin
MSISIGQAAPAFTLFDTDKKAISLSDYKGKNVVEGEVRLRVLSSEGIV